MKLTEFNSADIQRRTDIVFEWGFYVMNQKSGGFNKVLFFVNGFFAELTIRINDNKVISAKGISIDDMSPEYLDMIFSQNPLIEATLPKTGMLARLTLAA